ncbi:MAG: PLP-dependent aminotransferase family protein [Candidatus Eremiobacterota bacterium]
MEHELGESPRTRLYEQIAQNVQHLVESGTFKSGDRIPSVRALSKQMEVSVTTVLEAYRLLEDQGVIEARPQSGYYVRPNRPEPPAHPEPDVHLEGPSRVARGEIIMQFMRDIRNPNLLNLGAAVPNPEFLPTQKLNRTLAAVARDRVDRSNVYEFSPGCEELRVQLARRMLDAGCVLAPDDIVITNGCQEALMLCLRSVCEAGDTVAVESPTFYGHLKAIEMLELKAVEIPSHPDSGISLDALSFALDQHKVRAVVATPCYSNPIGSRMPEENKQQLVESLRQREIPLIEDDIYGDLSFSQHRPHACRAYDDSGNTMLCSSLSKTLAPGYRIGWAVPGPRRARVELLKTFTNIACPGLTQMAMAEFLATGGYDHHLRRVRRVYARQTGQMADAIGRHFPYGTRVTRPTGGFVLWVELPRTVDSLEVYLRALHEGISLAPGHLFSVGPRYRNFLRLNAAWWSPQVERAVALIGVIARTLESTPPAS